MGALDAWERFLSTQQTNLTRQQIAAYQGAVAERKIAMAYRMHQEKQAADTQELAASLGFRYDQLDETVKHWTSDRNLRAKLYGEMAQKWGAENARAVWSKLTDVAMARERLQQVDAAARRRDWISVQKALGVFTDGEGNVTQTIERERMDAQNAYNRDALGMRGREFEALNNYRDQSLGLRRDSLNSLNTFRDARLGQHDAALKLRAMGFDAAQDRHADRIPGRLGLTHADIESGMYDDWLLDEKTAWPEIMTPAEEVALKTRQGYAHTQRRKVATPPPASRSKQPDNWQAYASGYRSTGPQYMPPVPQSPMDTAVSDFFGRKIWNPAPPDMRVKLPKARLPEYRFRLNP